MIFAVSKNKAQCLLSSLLLCIYFSDVDADSVKAKYAQESKSTDWQQSGLQRRHYPIILTPQVVNISPGCFQMGSPETEDERGVDEMPHRVCVKGFKMGKNEITVEQFKQFIDATGFITDAERNTEELGCWSFQHESKNHWNWWHWANWKTPVRGTAITATTPVTCVSLYDVQAYVQWLNKETGQEYRLPTEAEWEYAARAGTTTARYWGNNPNIACGYANVADFSKSGSGEWPQYHECDDGYFFAAPVRVLRANRFGLYDMLGNVWEWTCSRYEETYNGSEEVCADIKSGSDVLISIRGGGWNANAPRVRSAYRNWGVPWSRQANQGFRLVRLR